MLNSLARCQHLQLVERVVGSSFINHAEDINPHVARHVLLTQMAHGGGIIYLPVISQLPDEMEAKFQRLPPFSTTAILT